MSNDLIGEYIRYYPKKSRKTKRDRRMVLEMFKEYMDKPLKEVKRSDVQKWVQHLENKGLKASTVNQYLSIVKNFYKFMPKQLEKPVTPRKQGKFWRRGTSTTASGTSRGLVAGVAKR